MVMEDGPPLLFDLEADPGETRNLADHESHAAILATLTEELLREWDLAAIHRGIAVTRDRTRLLYAWLKQNPPDHATAYVAPPGSNRLDEVAWTPRPGTSLYGFAG
jgi:hypothetical protein